MPIPLTFRPSYAVCPTVQERRSEALAPVPPVPLALHEGLAQAARRLAQAQRVQERSQARRFDGVDVRRTSGARFFLLVAYYTWECIYGKRAGKGFWS